MPMNCLCKALAPIVACQLGISDVDCFEALQHLKVCVGLQTVSSHTLPAACTAPTLRAIRNMRCPRHGGAWFVSCRRSSVPLKLGVHDLRLAGTSIT